MMRWILLMMIAAGVSAQDQPSRDLTVRLFDTARVARVTVTPVREGARWKACAGCGWKALDRPLTLNWKAGFVGVGFAGSIAVDAGGEHGAVAAGLWEVDAERDSLRVRVTLPSERYVAAVLMAEAAADEPPASLRALAIVVRSYGLAHKGPLTDSTSTQTMRLGVVSGAVAAAVRETAGETLWYGGHQVPAFFTQSSGGVTESAAAAWGGPVQGWLTSQADPASERAPSQWHGEISLVDLGRAMAGEGYRLGSPLKEVKVVRRTGSGRAARVMLVADAGNLEVAGSTFRFAVDRTLGWNRLRSDLYTVHAVGETVIFEGKGFGHGVGLSQAGARVLAVEGKDRRAILRSYFPGAEVRVTGADMGWKTEGAAGWSLVDTVANPRLVEAGDAAWQRAVKLVSPHEPVRPEVVVYPTVDLFRSATGEPGWTLAATRGERIALQPSALLAGNRPEEVLLHEMLHVLVERESSRVELPLWFREGLVEALAEGAGVSDPRAGLVEIEAHLLHPASLAEAQAAHRDAGAVVRRLGRVYSAATMLGWLRTGIPSDALVRGGIR